MLNQSVEALDATAAVAATGRALAAAAGTAGRVTTASTGITDKLMIVWFWLLRILFRFRLE